MIGTRAVLLVRCVQALRGVQCFAVFNIPLRSAFRGVAATRAANSPILKHFVGLLGNFLLIRVGLGLGAHGCVARLAEC